MYGEFLVYFLTQGRFDHEKKNENKKKGSTSNLKGVLGPLNIIFARLIFGPFGLKFWHNIALRSGMILK